MFHVHVHVHVCARILNTRSRLDTAGHPQVVLVTKKLDHIWDLGV